MDRVSTRVILSCAAIGVGGGLFAAGAGYLAGLIAVIAPVLYGVTIGTHFLPSAVGLALLRRPGTAVLTGLIAGLVASAFAPQWLLRYLGTGLLVGVLLELPFLVTRYRKWSAWLYYLAAGGSGVVLGVAVFIALGAEYYAPVVWAIALPLYVLSPIVFTWLGRVIAALPDPAPPLLLKIAPDLTEEDKADIAAVCLDLGVAGIIATNTTIARPEDLKGAARGEAGGLSGRPLFEPSTAVLRDLYRLTGGKLPLIGVGGVSSGEDAYRKISAGASLVQLYTGLIYGGPALVTRIKTELARLLREDGFETLRAAVGADHRYSG